MFSRGLFESIPFFGGCNCISFALEEFFKLNGMSYANAITILSTWPLPPEIRFPIYPVEAPPPCVQDVSGSELSARSFTNSDVSTNESSPTWQYVASVKEFSLRLILLLGFC